MKLFSNTPIKGENKMKCKCNNTIEYIQISEDEYEVKECEECLEREFFHGYDLQEIKENEKHEKMEASE